MIIGDHLSLELSEGLFDLGGIQFHNELDSLACGAFDMVVPPAYCFPKRLLSVPWRLFV